MIVFLTLLVIAAATIFFFRFWQLHFAITVIMYLFFIYLWMDAFMPVDVTKIRCGFPLFFISLFITPVYVIYHVYSIIYAKRIEDDRIIKINIFGLILCAINLICVL